MACYGESRKDVLTGPFSGTLWRLNDNFHYQLNKIISGCVPCNHVTWSVNKPIFLSQFASLFTLRMMRFFSGVRISCVPRIQGKRTWMIRGWATELMYPWWPAVMVDILWRKYHSVSDPKWTYDFLGGEVWKTKWFKSLIFFCAFYWSKWLDCSSLCLFVFGNCQSHFV